MYTIEFKFTYQTKPKEQFHVDRNMSALHETSGRREPTLAKRKSWDMGRREWGYDVAVATERKRNEHHHGKTKGVRPAATQRGRDPQMS
jgi:hypothetical protein